MIRIKGIIQMPENLYQLINAISEQKQKGESKGYLVHFKRLIDPVVIATFFGLFKSQELPPMVEEEISLENSYEFNVDISSFASILNHFLFCLWAKKKGLPNISVGILEYRGELYNFISKLLSVDYYRGVVIPFYLQKADDKSSGPSFLYRLWNSDKVGLELKDYSPEFLAQEFNTARSDFISNVIVPLNNRD